MFICLQEPGKTFGVYVQKEIDEFLQLRKNVILVCLKSKKLTSYLYEKYLKNCSNLFSNFV